MKYAYRDTNLSESTRTLIAQMNGLISDYQKQGYMLTVRQLYYQLVARDIIPNTLQSYKRVASIMNDARIAGFMDWDAIEDRTRDVVVRSRWESGQSILNGVAQQYHMDLWEGQPHRLFVIVEKEALVGVMDRVCKEFDVPLLAARGYPSVTVIRDLCLQHLQEAIYADQEPIILHLGDHDPSGIDMTRDLCDRIDMFLEHDSHRYQLKRLALNMAQVTETGAPANPAKTTDSRFAAYKRNFGTDSWELDALEPSYLDQLVRLNIESFIDTTVWEERRDQIQDVKTKLAKVAEEFEA